MHLSGGCNRTFLLREEAPEHHDLPDANNKQQKGLSDGPDGHTLKEVLCFGAVLGLPQSVPRLRLSHGLHQLVNSDAR